MGEGEGQGRKHIEKLNKNQILPGSSGVNLKFLPDTPKKFRGIALGHQVWQERHVYEYMTSVPDKFSSVLEFSV